MGYAGKTDAQIAGLLNTPETETIPRGSGGSCGAVGGFVRRGGRTAAVAGRYGDSDGVPGGMTVPVLKQLLEDIKYVDPINMQATTTQQFLSVLAAYG